MTEVVKFDAEIKQNAGTGAACAIRLAGNVPAILYGAGEGELMLSVSLKELEREYLKGGFRTKYIELKVGNEVINAIPKMVQLHPVSDKPIHVDFLRVNKNTTVKIAVTIKVINEDKSPGVKKGGLINLVHRTMDLLCHPTNIPSHIDIDVAGMEIGQNVHIEQVKLPTGVAPFDKSNFTILSIAGRAAEEEKAATPAAVAAVAPAGKAAPAKPAGK